MFSIRTASALRALIVICLLLPLASGAETVLVWGDSLSAAYRIPVEKGWVALLEEKLQAQQDKAWQVVNGSVSGETSSGGLSRLPAALQMHQPDILIIELGSNDGLRGQPPALLKRNLVKMIRLGKESGAQVLLVGNRIPPNYGASYTRRFAGAYTDAASDEQVPLVPFFMQDIASDDKLLQADRLHPTAEAQGMLLENVWPYLAPLL